LKAHLRAAASAAPRRAPERPRMRGPPTPGINDQNQAMVEVMFAVPPARPFG